MIHHRSQRQLCNFLFGSTASYKSELDKDQFETKCLFLLEKRNYYRQATAMVRKFGLSGHNPMTYCELGDQAITLGIAGWPLSSERMRQIIDKARRVIMSYPRNVRELKRHVNYDEKNYQIRKQGLYGYEEPYKVLKKESEPPWPSRSVPIKKELKRIPINFPKVLYNFNTFTMKIESCRVRPSYEIAMLEKDKYGTVWKTTDLNYGCGPFFEFTGYEHKTEAAKEGVGHLKDMLKKYSTARILRTSAPKRRTPSRRSKESRSRSQERGHS